ncbi:MAG: hypothetical protein ETSY1_39835 [Candidatus Entotheonella factor]|uniref:Cardiolipin synthase N-terminal domain-containing protein n=1 Tax=Entotheonella factor TaxID=1429438 RepID=W4L7J1_ENTF1|nr:tetratricopeptide repeat protein [Candidatus Entotheonella palauensis]ETW93291.1 MAG: hypothetical protein ETSY1_39835 [Candidatus Entotheonella factor]
MGFLVVVVLQAMFAAHAIQRGHGWNWVMLILFCPIIGFMLYAYLVAIPEMQHSPAFGMVGPEVKPFRDAESEIQYYQQQLDLADTVSNRTKLAQAWVKHGKPQEAIPLYETSLSGPYQDDLQLLYGLAQATFAVRDFAKTREILSTLIQAHPKARLQEQHLLYARTLGALNEFEIACQAYQELAAVYHGPQAKFHYAMMLKAHGEVEMAKGLLQEIDTTAKQSSNYYNAYHQECIGMARQELG